MGVGAEDGEGEEVEEMLVADDDRAGDLENKEEKNDFLVDLPLVTLIGEDGRVDVSIFGGGGGGLSVGD